MLLPKTSKKYQAETIADRGLNVEQYSAEELKAYNFKDVEQATIHISESELPLALESITSVGHARIQTQQGWINMRQNELLMRQNERIIHLLERLVGESSAPTQNTCPQCSTPCDSTAFCSQCGCNLAS